MRLAVLADRSQRACMPWPGSASECRRCDLFERSSQAGLRLVTLLRFAWSARVRVGQRSDQFPMTEGGSAMPRGSSRKRERQYEHIKDSARARGENPKRATEIAARTVNKERARSGESRTASRSSVKDMSAPRRGGPRSHSGAGGPTYQQLYNQAKQRGIKGRSSMTKAQLQRALAR